MKSMAYALSVGIHYDFLKHRVKWDRDAIQLAVNNPEHPFRKKVQELALQHFRLPLPIESPGILTLKPFTPQKFFGCTIWRGSLKGKGLKGKEIQDERSLQKTSFDPGMITGDNLLTGLKGEIYISGLVKIARTKETIQADGRFAQTLVEEEGQKTLRFLHDTFGIVWLEFLGTIVRDPSGFPSSLYLSRLDDGSWRCYYRALESSEGRYAHNPALGFET